MEVDQSFPDLFDTEDDEAEIHLTPAEIIQSMEEAWLNEKFAPEILPHKLDYVECLIGQIKSMEGNLLHAENKDVKKSLHQLEVDRLKYLVTSYLRIRLEKIETHAVYILKQEDERIVKQEEPYLTENELQFARNFKETLDQHFESVINYYPGFATEQWRNPPIEPNVHSFVFSKSKKEIEGIVIDDGNEEDTVYVDKGSQMIMSYYSVANLVKNGDVHLI